jgi:hypothetical protein
MFNNKTRYVLSKSVKVISEDPECSKNFNLFVSLTNHIFLDILDKNDFSYRVRLFMPNGEIIVCYIPHKPSNLIEIYNFEDLLDGRFNSTN